MKNKEERNLRRQLRANGELNDIKTFKEVQCQKLGGKYKAYIDYEADIIEGPDGLLYLNTKKGVELIVSYEYLRRKAEEEFKETLAKNKQVESSIKEMKPTPLGE